MNETAAHTSAAAAVLTVATWRQLYPHAVSGLYQPLIDACDAREITSPVRLAAFLAQWSHESLGFTRMYESFAYRSADRLVSVFGRRLLPANASVRGREAQKAAAALLRTRGAEAIANRVYAGRNGNGDEASGDGWRYCGRGIPQLTGRGNYREAGQALALPLEDKPELAALPEYTPAIAAWFWHRGGCNTMADRDDFRAITHCINGAVDVAATGFEERKREWARARVALGLRPLP